MVYALLVRDTREDRDGVRARLDQILEGKVVLEPSADPDPSTAPPSGIRIRSREDQEALRSSWGRDPNAAVSKQAVDQMIQQNRTARGPRGR